MPLTVASPPSSSGCFVSKVDPQKPELPLPAALPAQADADVAAAGSVVDDLPRRDARQAGRRSARSTTPTSRVAAARVAEARAGLRITNADRLPNLRSRRRRDALEAEQLARCRTRLPGRRPAADDSTRCRARSAIELDLWGRYQRASESARAQLLNTEYGREATKLSLTGEVARGYFGLIAAAEQLARGRDTLATRAKNRVRLEKLRFDSGESDEFTFKRAEADAAATRVSMHQLELEVVQRTNALGMLLGRSPKDLVDAAISVQGVSRCRRR